MESPHLYLRIKEQGHVPVAMRIATLTCLPGPSPFLFLLAQLLVRLLLPGPESVGAASPCPSLCTCSNQASRVICTRQNLEEVPESISVNTRYLNLQENSIQVNMGWRWNRVSALDSQPLDGLCNDSLFNRNHVTKQIEKHFFSI